MSVLWLLSLHRFERFDSMGHRNQGGLCHWNRRVIREREGRRSKIADERVCFEGVYESCIWASPENP